MPSRQVRRPKKLGMIECPVCRWMTIYEEMQYRTQCDDHSRAIICDNCVERREVLGL